MKKLILILIFIITFVIFFKGLKNSNIYTPDTNLKKEVPSFKLKSFEDNSIVISEKIFKVGFEKLSFVPFHDFFFMIRQIPTLITLKSYLSVFRLVSKFIKNEQIRENSKQKK